MDTTKYTYGKIMNVESPGSDVFVSARDVNWQKGGNPATMLKDYIYDDGFIGWVPNPVIANLNMASYQGLPDKQELVNLDKGEKPKTVKTVRFIFIPMNPPDETKETKDLAGEILSAKAQASREKIMALAEEGQDEE